MVGGKIVIGIFNHYPGPTTMPGITGADQPMRLGNVDKKVVAQYAVPSSPVPDAH
jgi:hypothetical protein